MRKKLFFMVCVCLAFSKMTAHAVITDVSILPEEPIVIDPITIITSGLEGHGDIVITNSNFLIDGTSLELAIYFDVGPYTVITPWLHSEDIGALLMGTYDLTVNTIVEQEPILNDTRFTTFEVVPEPSTLLLFGLGGLAFRKRR